MGATTTSCARSDPRFAIQHIDDTTWMAATSANLAADYAHGYVDPVARFLRDRPEWSQFSRYLAASNAEQLREFVALRRSHSLAFLVMMLTGVCNADCPICFTDRKKKANELPADERIRVLREAKELGARYVYIPGEGEPTLDKAWWPLLAEAAALDLPIVAFTNGIIFSDEDTCSRVWGMSCAEAIARLARYPVSLYLKFWTTDAAQASAMLRVPQQRLAYQHVDGVDVPGGLARMLESDFPRDRLGVEVVIERRNVDEVLSTIAPFAEQHGLASIVEMLQHNGRTLGDPSYDIDPSYLTQVEPLLSPTSCTIATCKAVVTVQGYLSPRIAVLEHQIPGEPADVRTGALFDLLHTTDYLVERRYELSCLCESIPAELSGQTSQVPVTSVPAPGFEAWEPGGSAATETSATPGCGTSACGSGSHCSTGACHSSLRHAVEAR